MPQNSVSDSPAVAYVGQIAEAGAPSYCRSASAEGSGIAAGSPVIRGTSTESQVAAIGASSIVTPETFAGFVVLETSRPEGGISDTDGVSVMQEGHIYLTAGEAVTAGEDVALNKTSGAFVGLGSEEHPAAGVVRLPGCKWATDTASSGLGICSVRAASGGQGDRFFLSAEFAVAGMAGDDIAEEVLGCVPQDCRLVSAYFVPAAAVTAGTGATAINYEINKRTKAAPGTQVAVAQGSNVDAESQAFNGDGAVAAWEASAFTLVSESVAQLTAEDTLTFEIVAGASATYPAGKIILEFLANG